MAFGDFKGRAKRLDDIDLPRIGHKIGVGEDELHAFMEVEARGSGFDRQGRPAMLFEPHLFWRELGAGNKRDRAAAQGLAYASWRSGAYPSDSYPRLQAAMLIDETAAIRSASWGLGQILASNHKLAGYATPQAMVVDFMDDEERHLEAMVKFLISAKLDDDLRAHRWEALARGYNGPAYAKHGYHTRLAAAYAKWSRIKDTPWTPQDSINETKESGGPAADVVFPPPPKPPIPVVQVGEPVAIPVPPAPGFWARFGAALKRRMGGV